LPPQQLPPSALQHSHGGGEILDHEADHGTGGEVLVVLVGWAEHLKGAPLRELEGGEVRSLLAGGQPEDRLKEGHHGAVLACPGACPPDARDPHPASPYSGAWRPRSCHVAAGGPSQYCSRTWMLMAVRGGSVALLEVHQPRSRRDVRAQR